MGSSVRRLGPEDTERRVATRSTMRLDGPLAPAASPEDDLGAQPGQVREFVAQPPGNVVFDAFARGAGCSSRPPSPRHGRGTRARQVPRGVSDALPGARVL